MSLLQDVELETVEKESIDYNHLMIFLSIQYLPVNNTEEASRPKSSKREAHSTPVSKSPLAEMQEH